MPELPEVETVVRGLRGPLIGQKIDRADLRRADILTPPDVNLIQLLTGRTIVDISRRGKKIVFTLDDGNRFYIHLGMSGRLTFDEPNAPLKPHTHLILFINRKELRFVDPRRFGGVWWLGLEGSIDGNLGPEPLTLSTVRFSTRLLQTSRAIKVALLDQTLIAGIGNIYADEALFAAKIHPLTKSSTLTRTQVAALNRAIKQILRRAINARGSTLRDYRDASGQPGVFKKLHRVYDRAGQLCVSCKNPIERIVLGGRSTHFCPHCQKG